MGVGNLAKRFRCKLRDPRECLLGRSDRHYDGGERGVMNPCDARTITIPVVAEELCTRAVNTAATAIPRNGLLICVILTKSG